MARRRRTVPSLFLRLALIAVAGVTVLVGVGLALAWFLVPVDTVGDVDFDSELAIPPLAESTVDADGRRVFELTAQEGTTQIAGERVRTWGFDGDYLGPTLRAERGEDVAVRIANTLPEDTTVHWHGMHVPAAMDGGPHQPIEAGGQWTPEWTVDQPAATLWYHPHPHGRTGEHVARGLVGMFLLDDPVEQELGLPSGYGVDDLPLIVTDPSVRRGEVDTNADRGQDVLVNGTAGPYVDVDHELIRLRLLNASGMRVYEFGLDDGSPLVQVAGDGGLLPEPHETTGVRLSPGERAEVLVRLEPGETRVLRSADPDLGMNAIGSRFNGGADRWDVLELRAAQRLEPAPVLPDTLVPDIAGHAGAEDDAVRTREFELNGRTINGRRMDMDRVDEVVTLGDTEVWEVSASGGEPHNFHVHDVQFRVLSVDGAAPGPELSGLKDTVFLEQDRVYRLLLTFTDYADPAVPYMFHCHLLRHEDQGMMGQFVVVEEGQQPDLAPMDHGGHEGHDESNGHEGPHNH